MGKNIALNKTYLSYVNRAVSMTTHNAQIYPHLRCLLSYTTSLGTNLMLIHIMFT